LNEISKKRVLPLAPTERRPRRMPFWELPTPPLTDRRKSLVREVILPRLIGPKK